jgi:AAA ATPase domain
VTEGTSTDRAAGGVSELLGRRGERQALDQLMADVEGGSSRVLVLRGEAGVGKSALLGYVRQRAASWRLVSAIGVESEVELAYSALQQVCAPLLKHLAALPAPQRLGLETVQSPTVDDVLGNFSLYWLTNSAVSRPGCTGRTARRT